MKRKLQVVMTDESWNVLENANKEANQDFKTGFISLSDIVNEMILNSKIDIRGLQIKHTNVRKSLRQLSSLKEIDLDLAIKSLQELKISQSKKGSKAQPILKVGDV